jgi:hypothetical protein
MLGCDMVIGRLYGGESPEHQAINHSFFPTTCVTRSRSIAMVRQQAKRTYDVLCQTPHSNSESVHLDPAESPHHLAIPSREPMVNAGMQTYYSHQRRSVAYKSSRSS